jgi:hypothetical protein
MKENVNHLAVNVTTMISQALLASSLARQISFKKSVKKGFLVGNVEKFKTTSMLGSIAFSTAPFSPIPASIKPPVISTF